MLRNNEDEDTELIIGLTGAVGANFEAVKRILIDQLKQAGYEPQVIKISNDVIPGITDVSSECLDNPFERIRILMDAGNKCRRNACQVSEDEGMAVLAYGAAAMIYGKREKGHPLFRQAFIIDSLKRPEEIDALRAIYPSGFILVGVHEEEKTRVVNLCGSDDVKMTKDQARELLERDSNEKKNEWGQRVSKTYHLSDFFVQVPDHRSQLESAIERLVHIWFGDPFLTPTFDEYAMYLAFAAALRSADLSRQVGAVVARDQEILSTGANECPKAGGGLYWPIRKDFKIQDLPDGRDHTLGMDSNREEQLKIIQDIISILPSSLSEEQREEFRKKLASTTIQDITEYGRVVHAEMEALLACARTQSSTVEATIYCTTFPCHNCAKHIIAAGIKRVVFIEPYEKSKALAFHKDAIKNAEPEEGNSETDGHREKCENRNLVKFEPFVGVGPRRFYDLFSMSHGSSYPLIRKNRLTGRKLPWTIRKAKLRLQMNPSSYLNLEKDGVQLFSKLSNTKGNE